jgi:hypothetical protein
MDLYQLSRALEAMRKQQQRGLAPEPAFEPFKLEFIGQSTTGSWKPYIRSRTCGCLSRNPTRAPAMRPNLGVGKTHALKRSQDARPQHGFPMRADRSSILG